MSNQSSQSNQTKKFTSVDQIKGEFAIYTFCEKNEVEDELILKLFNDELDISTLDMENSFIVLNLARYNLYIKNNKEDFIKFLDMSISMGNLHAPNDKFCYLNFYETKEEAISFIEKFNEEETNNFVWLWNMNIGLFYYNEQNYEKSEIYLKKSLEFLKIEENNDLIKSYKEVTFNSLITIYYKIFDFNSILELLFQMDEVDLELMTSCYIQTENLKKAIQTYELFLKLTDQKSHPIVFEIAMLSFVETGSDSGYLKEFCEHIGEKELYALLENSIKNVDHEMIENCFMNIKEKAIKLYEEYNTIEMEKFKSKIISRKLLEEENRLASIII
jgi:tetratricopeptide (TPR) repeat protein